MKKDTLRLLLFLDCNFNCSYCCNKNEDYYSKFIHLSPEEVDFTPYDNVCLTGGEPFLDPDLVFKYMDLIPSNKTIYLYTNAVLITRKHIIKLKTYENLGCINIGLHHQNQIHSIDPSIEYELPVRFLVEDIKASKVCKASNYRVNGANSKQWVRDQCDVPNEDWVVLK